MHFQVVPAWAIWEADIEGDSPGGGRVKREGWERKPGPTCVHAATSHLRAQREMRTFYSPREGAVCSAQLWGHLHCCFRPLVHWLGKCLRRRKELIFLGTSAPRECCSTDTTYQSCCLPTISLFSLLGIFNTHTRMSVSKLNARLRFQFLRCAFTHTLSFSVRLIVSVDIQLYLRIILKKLSSPLSSQCKQWFVFSLAWLWILHTKKVSSAFVRGMHNGCFERIMSLSENSHREC